MLYELLFFSMKSLEIIIVDHGYHNTVLFGLILYYTCFSLLHVNFVITVKSKSIYK